MLELAPGILVNRPDGVDLVSRVDRHERRCSVPLGGIHRLGAKEDATVEDTDGVGRDGRARTSPDKPQRDHSATISGLGFGVVVVVVSTRVTSACASLGFSCTKESRLQTELRLDVGEFVVVSVDVASACASLLVLRIIERRLQAEPRAPHPFAGPMV